MPNSPNRQGPDQDQRENGSVEDSTTMTIEFLRARLLSERSVSRTARQRADELAKRVVELEEQLKIVSLQRKKAEKATAYVLSILENHGISEFSEEFDSISDQEVITCEGNNSPEEEESSVGSKIRRNHTDEFSISELESSPIPGRSLSWKRGKNSLHSCERNYKDSSTRWQRNSVSTTSTSPRCRVARSCRQMRRRETRSAVEKSQIDNNMLAPHDNGVATCTEVFPTRSVIGPETSRESIEKQDAKVFLEGPISGVLENQKPVANASSYLNVHGSDKDMEKALEHQAQLIGQYEEEEKAQREWEEKFTENNNSTPDSCEPGNHSDITEERDETKAHASPYPIGTIASQDLEAKLKMQDVCITKVSSKSQSDGFQSPPPVVVGCFLDQKSSSMLAHESPASDFVFPVATGKQDQEYSGDHSVPPSHSYHHRSCSEGPTGNQSAHIVPSHAGSSICEGETSGSKNEHYALISRETPDKLGSVLEALYQAKLSLKHKLNALPTIDGGSVGKAIDLSSGDRPEVPVGYAGLFRVPSDFHLEATRKANFLGSNSQLSLTNYYPDAGSALTAVNQSTTSPYTESRSSVSTGDRHLAIPKVPSWEPLDSRSRFPSHKPFLGPSMDTVIPSSSRYAYNDPNMNTGLASSNIFTSTYPFYPDPMPRLPFNEGSRLFSSSGAGMPPANQFSFYDVHVRPPNAYR